MQSVSLPEQQPEQMRALTQQYIQNFDQFMMNHTIESMKPLISLIRKLMSQEQKWHLKQ
ncbi:unnamed protein product [Paramecium primaurelia]|uniref:Uncharacterized protein n=1 Tax=Paramecium primaurelia TaxID=5886 RepID=A0A8S1JR18_PARPR|nr:unnamed protein product [Paramecium primaurelia]